MSCLILLDNYQGRYYAGGDVIGKVVCSFKELNTIKGIELKLKGWEKNDWKRISGSRIDSYSGHNEFLYASNILHEGGDIGPGTFEYPFIFHLPDNIPSSYKGRDGGISFFLIAAVDIPLSTDCSDKKEIVVISPINFNLMQNQLQLKPVSYSNDEMITCCCCSCGNVTMDVRLEKTAFVPGEVAKVKVDINNMSSERVEWIKLLLGMYIKSMVSYPYESKCDLQVLATDGASGVLPDRQKAYCFNLEIPKSAQVPNFASCKLFSQKTTLKVKAGAANCNINLNIDLDITMGHIPIQNPSVPVEQYLLDIPLPTDPPSNHQPRTRKVLYPATQNRISDGEQYSSYTDATYPMMIPYSSLQDSIPDPIDFITLQCNDGTYFASSPGAACNAGVTDNDCGGGVTDNDCYGGDVDSGPCCDNSAVDCGGDSGGCGSDD